MKTTWKIVFALLLLLPLAGCEEDCTESNTSPANSAEQPEPIKFGYLDRLTGDYIPLSEDTIAVKAGSIDRGLFGVVYGVGSVILRTGAEPIPSILIYNENYRRDPFYEEYYIEFSGTRLDTLRVETESLNVGDCDELRSYRFYYNGRLVFTSDDPTELFFVEK